MNYVIERENRSTANGKKDPERVYVTGPHFGADVWSSTLDPAEAAKWPTPEAACEAASERYWSEIRVVPLDEAKALTR